jgi:serine/threonine protein phosphatase PrpC
MAPSPKLDLRIAVSARTHEGRVRDHNEDAFLVTDLEHGRARRDAIDGAYEVTPRGILLAVSDGMGGAKAGEVASTLSLEALFDELRSDRGGTVEERLQRDVVRASRRVREAGKRPDRRGMGATLTAALFCGLDVHLAQIGDSRAYLLRGGSIRQVTHDQSYVQMLVDEGIMTPEEAERSPEKNVILQAMGQKGDVRVAIGHIAVRPGDRLLLCSDGLTNEISDDEILKIGSRGPVEAASQALVDAANAAGGKDNVTVVLAEIEG